MRTTISVIAVIALAASFYGCASVPKAQKAFVQPEMIYIPEGEFIFGSNPDDEKRGIMVGIDEQPQQKVFLEGYYIDKYEVMNKEFKSYVDATGHRIPFDWKDNMYPDGEADFPVAHIDWFDADAYCKWAGKRLPTEQEWEKAARGTDARIYPWGDVFDKSKANTKDWRRERIPVGSMSAGASPYGVMDMSGNVWEWTSSWYDAYPGSTLKRPEFGEIYRVIRGGAWNAYSDLSRTNERFSYPPKQSYQCFVGVRCVKDP